MPRVKKRRSVTSHNKSTKTSEKKRALTGKALIKRNELVEQYHSYVEVVVSRLIRVMRLPGGMKDEFVSAGLLGLIEAAGRYRPELGQEFRAYAFLRIRGAVIDYIRSSCELSGYAYRRLKALEMAQQLREQQLEDRKIRGLESKNPSLAAIAHLEQVALIFRLAGQTEEEEAHDPERRLGKKRRDIKIRQAVATLPEKERTIIEQHYFQDHNLSEVAERFAGLSKSWVSRLHDRAIRLLRERIIAEIPELAA